MGSKPTRTSGEHANYAQKSTRKFAQVQDDDFSGSAQSPHSENPQGSVTFYDTVT